MEESNNGCLETKVDPNIIYKSRNGTYIAPNLCNSDPVLNDHPELIADGKKDLDYSRIPRYIML